MKCYQHRDRDAVATCSYCSKGICGDCAREGPTWAVCGTACDTGIRNVRGLLDKAGTGYSTTGKTYRALGWAMVALGLLAIALPFLFPGDGDPSDLYVMGAVAAGLGAVLVNAGRTFRALAGRAPPSDRAP